MSTGDLTSLVERLEKVAGRLEKVASNQGASGGAAVSAEDVPFVKAYDEIMNTCLADYVKASGTIGGLVSEQAQLLKSAMEAQRVYLVTASRSKQPTDQKVVRDLLAPTSDKITAILEIKEKNRRSEFFNHLAALAEGVSALAWVTITPAPSQYVKEMADAGMFYVNRALKDFKDKGPEHKQWAQSLQSLFWKELQLYVKEYHTTGLAWNPQGGNAAAFTTAAPPPPAGGPPPPPPGGLPPPPPPTAAAPAPSGSDANALFAEINKGSAITSGLRKVTDDMKTHKNPGLKKVSDDMKTHKNPALRTGPAPFKPATAPKPSSTVKAPKAAAPPKPVAKPPLVELDGKKWIVEYLVDNTNTVIEDTNPKQSVYVFKCSNSTIQVKGKINSITLDSCKKTAVVFDDAISVVEFVNCQSVKAQVMGKVPTISIEKTDGCQVFLSKDSLDSTFISAKSSEMNVVVPTADGDYSEYAIAEQFRTVFNGKTLVTEVNDIAA